jgi:D-alanyl-lipoteichoic acid acyltransferase DltB (MBOAT superfamily)
MLFPTPEFAIFFAVVFAAAWALRGRDEARKGALVAASYVFYGWWSWGFAALLAASSVASWAAGRAIARLPGRAGGAVAALAVAADLAVLGYFKYADFFLSQLNAALAAAGVDAAAPLLGLAVPVGVSFFTFHAISYVVDVRAGRLARPAPLLDVLLYQSFFPHLVAGPIVRASAFMGQLERPAGTRPVPAPRAAALILGGLVKKVALASPLATYVVDPVFRDPAAWGAADLLAAAFCYSAQVYLDFSAYTDMAIGFAALLGYEFPLNFDAPYSALGFSDFWRRWHISLSAWLRDYLYIPLGGSRGSAAATDRNLMAVMLLGGLWHGAAWTFVLWGALHGTALVAERRARPLLAPLAGRPVARAAGRLGTLLFVTAAWVPFRCPDFATLAAFASGLSRWSAPLAVPPLALAMAAAVVAAQQLPRGAALRAADRACRFSGPWAPLAGGAAAGAAAVLVMALVQDRVAPFIYFQF